MVSTGLASKLSLQLEINDLEAVEAKGGSGALSEIPADDDHMRAAWGQVQLGCLPSSVQVCPTLCHTLLLRPGRVLTTADRPLASVCLCHRIAL